MLKYFDSGRIGGISSKAMSPVKFQESADVGSVIVSKAGNKYHLLMDGSIL